MEIERMVRMAWKNYAVVLMVSFLIITSPCLPLVLYFLPLIMSTVLCTVVLVSIVPHEAETEFVDDFVGESHKIITSGSSQLLGSYATWLQWLMGMDHYRVDQIGSDIISTSSSSQELMCEETIVAGAPSEEHLVEDYAASSEEEILSELSNLATSYVKPDDYNVGEELAMDCFEVEASIQDLDELPSLEAEGNHRLTFLIYILQKVFKQVRRIGMNEIRKWLSLLNCVLLDQAANWSRKKFREEKISRPDLYGSMFIPERITVRLREDSEQQFLKLTEVGNEDIMNLAGEPQVDTVEFCTVTSSYQKSGHLAMGSLESINHRVDSDSYLEDELSSAEDSASDCSDILDDPYADDNLSNFERISTIESSFCEQQLAKEDESKDTEIFRSKTEKMSMLVLEGLNSADPNASKVGAASARAQGLNLDHNLLNAHKEKLELVEPFSEKMLTSFVDSSTDDLRQTQLVIGDANLKMERRETNEERISQILFDASAMNSMTEAQAEGLQLTPVETAASNDEGKESSREDKLHPVKQSYVLPNPEDTTSKHVRSWPTVQEVFSTRTKDSNFAGLKQNTTVFVVCLLTQQSNK